MIIYEDGTILNDAYDGRVIHERNGRFDIEFKLPTNNDKYKLLKKFGVIETKVPYLNEQKFDITSIKKKLGYIEVFANHVGFRLDKNVTKDITSSNVLANTILQRFKASLQKETEFNFMSDITDSRQFNTVGFENALDTLTKGKHSILGQWGGVLVFDNFNIELRKRFGRDTEYLIAKRKNINDLEIDEKSDGVITRLIISKEIELDGDKELIYATVDSPLIEEYPEVYLRHIETTDETIETVEDLIAYGEDVFRLQKIDLPTESFTIDTAESINNFNFTIDDTAIIHYEDYGIDKRVMVTSYEYDPISKRYIKVHFGDKEKSLLQSTTDTVTDKIETEIINPNMTYIDRVFDEIRDNLKDPTGGVIKFTKDNEGNIIEILILDDEDLDQAMEVWRWNIQGLSHSSNGINGDFNVAITQDGKIVADFMTTGVLTATLIRAGVLKGGKVRFDLEEGTLLIGNSPSDYNLYFDGNELHIRLSSGNTIEQEFEDTKNSAVDLANDALEDAKAYAKSQDELLKVGAANLANESSEISIPNNTPRVKIHDGLMQGDYTISFGYELLSGVLTAFMLYTDSQIVRISKQDVENGRITKTFNLGSVHQNKPIYLYSGESTAEATANKVTVSELMLQKGTKATGWQLSNTDINNMIGNVLDTVRTENETSLEILDDSIMQKVKGSYTSTSDFESYQTEVSSSFTHTDNKFVMDFNRVTEKISGLEDLTGEQFEILNTYIKFENGEIELGDRERKLAEGESLFTVLITKEKIQFKENGNEVAYISNNRLYITDGQFKNSLRLGNFAFTPRASGNLSFGKVN